MGRLMLGRKSEYGLKEGAKEIPLYNGMYVTADYKEDVQTTNLLVRLASKKAGINYKELLSIVLDDTRNIKETIYNNDEIIEESNNNFNKKLEFYLHEINSSLKTADEITIKTALIEMERDYRYDIRLLICSTFKDTLIDNIIAYYNSYINNELGVKDRYDNYL